MKALHGTPLTSARAVGLAALLMATPALSQHRVEAEQREGVQMLRRGDNEAALALFRRLYEQTREPRALWRMGTAEAALGRWVEAEAHMTLAFASSGDPWIQQERDGLAQTLRRVQARVGLLTVRCNAPGATVTVGDRVVTEFPAHVVAGEVSVTVSAPGHRPQSLVVAVPGSVEQALVREVDLQPLEPPPAPVVVAPPPPVVVTPPVIVAPLPAGGRGGGAIRVAGIASLAAGGGALVLGGVGLALRNAAATRFNDDHACWSREGAVQGGSGCEQQADAATTWQAVSIAGFVAGGALAAAGVVLLVAAPGSERASAQGPRVHLTMGPGDLGLGVSGRW